MEKFKDIIIRCLKTFIQGFLATLLVTMQNGNMEITKSILIGAIAGGLSATMNLMIKLLEGNTDLKIETINGIGSDEDEK